MCFLPPPTRGGRRGQASACARRAGGCRASNDILDDIVEILQHISVPETQHPIAPRVEECRAFGIALHVLIEPMLRAVKFHNDLRSVAREIGDIGTDRDLATKVQLLLFQFSQGRPKKAFRQSGVFAQRTGSLDSDPPTRRPIALRALWRRPPRIGGGETESVLHFSINLGMISTKLQGLWRMSSCHLRMPSQPSFTAPGEPGRAKR